MLANRGPTHCPACRLQTRFCVCVYAPRIEIQTPLLLVVHVHELGRTSNTVRLLDLAIRGTIIIRHGVYPAPADPETHVPEGRTPVVLFPGHGAKPLTPELIAALPSPPALVVPDGNWKQASRMVKRLPLLTSAVKVALPDRAFAGTALRRNRPGHRMSTYEAVTQALTLLEGEAIEGHSSIFIGGLPTACSSSAASLVWMMSMVESIQRPENVHPRSETVLGCPHCGGYPHGYPRMGSGSDAHMG